MQCRLQSRANCHHVHRSQLRASAETVSALKCGRGHYRRAGTLVAVSSGAAGSAVGLFLWRHNARLFARGSLSLEIEPPPSATRRSAQRGGRYEAFPKMPVNGHVRLLPKKCPLLTREVLGCPASDRNWERSVERALDRDRSVRARHTGRQCGSS